VARGLCDIVGAHILLLLPLDMTPLAAAFYNRVVCTRTGSCMAGAV
jgi:hypothetical protein